MTEEEWLTSTDPLGMLRLLRDEASQRKLRLFAVVCCRRSWHLLEDARSKLAVEAGEKYADGSITDEERSAIEDATPELADASGRVQFASWAAISSVFNPLPNEHILGASRETFIVGKAYASAVRSAEFAARAIALGYSSFGAWQAEVNNKERGDQCRFVRDIFGNPFRPVTFDLAWLTPTVKSLAAAIYEDRQLPSGLYDNGRLAILADALEEAGCDNAEILGHLRGGGEHVRGCWVIDLLTGRE